MTRPTRSSDYVVAAEVINDLGRHVYLVRMARGLSQTDVADAVSVHYTLISKIERGTQVPGLTTIVRLLRWLAETVAQLPDGPTDREVIGDETRDP